jgi:hypothetical protein
LASVLHRAANDLAREGTEIARQGLVVSITLKAQRLVPVVAVVARVLGAEPLGKPVVVFRPCVSGIPQRLGFAAMPLPDFQLDLLGLGAVTLRMAFSSSPLPFQFWAAMAALRSAFCAGTGPARARSAPSLRAAFARGARGDPRGGDVVIPAGQVRPQRLWLALDRHDSRAAGSNAPSRLVSLPRLHQWPAVLALMG